MLLRVMCSSLLRRLLLFLGGNVRSEEGSFYLNFYCLKHLTRKKLYSFSMACGRRWLFYTENFSK